jgi:hypothetical protein
VDAARDLDPLAVDPLPAHAEQRGRRAPDVVGLTGRNPPRRVRVVTSWLAQCAAPHVEAG